MSVESVDTAVEMGYELAAISSLSNTDMIESPGSSLHEKIHSPSPYFLYQSDHEFSASRIVSSESTTTIKATNASTKINADAGGRGEVGGEITWGPDGIDWDIYGRGEVYDDNGNTVGGEIRQSSDGTGSLRGYGSSSWD